MPSLFRWSGALLPALFVAPVLGAKPVPESLYIDKVLEAAGGAARFARLETLQGRYTLVSATETVSFDFAARRTPAGWVVREEGPGAVLLWTSSGAVAAGSAEAVRASRDRFFWLLGPYHLQALGGEVRYRGLGYLRGELLRRVSVRPPEGGELTVYLATENFVLRGAGGADGTWRFEDPATFQNQVSLATGWTRLSPEGHPRARLRLDGLVLNAFLEDALFQPAPGHRWESFSFEDALQRAVAPPRGATP